MMNFDIIVKSGVMQKLKFSVNINAPRKKIWDILWNDKTYREWTSVFNEGSHAESDWTEGSEILFLSGEGEGMYSTIAAVEPDQKMSFRHLGTIKNGVKQPLDEETRKWSGAMENYYLKESGDHTVLSVDLDIEDDYTSYFENSFPQALQKVKELAEN